MRDPATRRGLLATWAPMRRSTTRCASSRLNMPTRQCIGEADERGPHSPHHLNRTRAEVSDLVEGEGEIVPPGRRREHEPQSAVLIDGVAGVQFRCAETAQEVLELVD